MSLAGASGPPADAVPLPYAGLSIAEGLVRRPAETRSFSLSLEALMSIVLWILQVVLAAVFLAHGWMFLSPPPDLLALMNEQLGAPFRVFLGIAEIAGAAGLILPALSRVRPGLTPLAAACLAFIVLSATVLHVARAEYGPALMTAALCLLGSFLAYGRWRLRPIAPRHGARPSPHVTTAPFP